MRSGQTGVIGRPSECAVGASTGRIFRQSGEIETTNFQIRNQVSSSKFSIPLQIHLLIITVICGDLHNFEEGEYRAHIGEKDEYWNVSYPHLVLRI